MSLATVLTHLDNARGALVDSLNSKGVTVASSATLYECADGISSLTIGTDVSSTTAEASDVLSGKVFYNSGGTLTSGTIPTVSAAISSGAVVVPSGFIASSQSFPVSSGGGTDVSDTTATPATVLGGYDFYDSAGVKTSGTIPTVSASLSANVATVPNGYIATAQTLTVPEAGAATVSANVVTIPAGYVASQTEVPVGSAVSAATITPTTSNQVISSGGYLIGDQTILGDAALVGSNIASGVSIFGVAGTLVTSGGAEVTLGVVDSAGKFQAFSFNGTTPSDSGQPETITDYKSWNSTLPAPANPTVAGLIDRSITSITIPAGVTSIGMDAFAYCTILSSITIPEGVTSIGQAAFYACVALTSLTLPASMTTIASNAFTACTNLADIYCGFTSGTVTGAPWGAPNATVHYAE